MHTILRRAAFLIALAGLGLTAGCTALSDLNPLDRGSNEPLPPVTGNVIATSSSSDLTDRLGTTGSAGTAAQPTITGEAGTSVEECRRLQGRTPGSPDDGFADGTEPDNCVRGSISTN
ncbi:MAG: hypothetical protein ABL307_09325 [Roseitalea porphyridii]|uniref:hypothetical protein n=1 Tax=Roseitalea porphyridii TaxID=1852022 RepID=UPI0032D9480F